MNTKQLDAAIRAQIDQFLVFISALVRRAAVEAVREALEDGAAPAGRRGPGRPTKASSAAPRSKAAAKPGRRTRRSSTDVEKVAAKVLDYVRSHPGERLEEIGRGLGTNTAGLKRPIQGLLAASELRTEGQKRGTRYFAGGGAGGGAGSKTKGGKATKQKPTAGRRAKKAAKPLVVKPARKRGAKKGARKAKGRAASAAEPVTAA